MRRKVLPLADESQLVSVNCKLDGTFENAFGKGPHQIDVEGTTPLFNKIID
jgi:hypothetical protein